ncbi:MAG TPA: pyrroline-5-carboxylate reductase [Rhabdochlamydiaceae bacterium]|nr:pyrroline-5-carboxylate reductase [Rhabdochlamydiaceae bacterium]
MKIAIVGCGVIGSALARHFADKHQVLLSDHTYQKSLALAQALGAVAYESSVEAIEKAEMVIIAIKPKDLAAFAKDTAHAFKHGPIVVSVLAGTPVALLKRLFSSSLIVRIMPNLPMICGEGVIGFVDTPEMTDERKKHIEAAFEGLGLLHWISEDQLEALSAIAGSGPAFNFVLIQAMIDSGVMLGFTPEEAKEYVLKTIEGSVALLKASGKTAQELIDQVASPGGTTRAGLKVMEENDIHQILLDTYQATFQRAKELH